MRCVAVRLVYCGGKGGWVMGYHSVFCGAFTLLVKKHRNECGIYTVK